MLKNKSFKVLFFILSVMIFWQIGTINNSSFAEEDTELSVNGVNILTTEGNTVKCGEGTATYNKEKNILTLNNATISQTASKEVIAYKGGNPLTIKLQGNSKIIMLSKTKNLAIASDGGGIKIEGSSKEDKLDIVCPSDINRDIIYLNNTLDINNCSLEIEEESPNKSENTEASDKTINKWNAINVNTMTCSNASLSINGAFYYGIVCSGTSINKCDVTIDKVIERAISNENDSSNITINDSKVKATVTDGYALYANGNINISGNSDITAEGKRAGISSIGDLTINNSKVKATATDTDTDGYALSASGNINISGNSDITAEGKEDGISSIGDLTINNSKVKATATGTDGYALSAGEKAGGKIEISGNSDITAEGKRAGIKSYGDLTINNSKVKATSTDNNGINIGGNLTLNGGSLEVKGGTYEEKKCQAICVGHSIILNYSTYPEYQKQLEENNLELTEEKNNFSYTESSETIVNEIKLISSTQQIAD